MAEDAIDLPQVCSSAAVAACTTGGGGLVSLSFLERVGVATLSAGCFLLSRGVSLLKDVLSQNFVAHQFCSLKLLFSGKTVHVHFLSNAAMSASYHCVVWTQLFFFVEQAFTRPLIQHVLALDLAKNSTMAAHPVQ